MKKLLLVVAMLLAASQVMAGVTITAVNEGTFALADGNRAATVRVDYSGDINVRAFALNFAVDNNCNFQNIRDFKVGENTGTGNGYGIFPGRFRQFINPANPAWGDANANSNYNPTPPWADPGTTGTGIGFGTMIVEMGYLGAGDANKPAQSGTLFRVDVNGYKFEGTAHVTITADAMRGGVVDKDTNATTTATTYVGVNIVFPQSCVTPTNEVDVAKATAEAVWVAQGFTLGTATPVVNCAKVGLIISQDTACVALPAAINYSYGVAPAEPNVAGMSRSAAKAALEALGFVVGADINVPPTATYATVRTVRGQNPPAGTTGCGTTVNLSVVSYPIKDMTVAASLYVNWVNRGRPACWAYPRQCRGDADGKKLGTLWVSGNDLTLFRARLSKTEAQLTAMADGYCADFDHKKLGTLWVSGNDLTILRANLSKAEAAIPVCGTVLNPSTDPNYWYFCVPTGVACPTTPAGTVCAPAGICPNTP